MTSHRRLFLGCALVWGALSLPSAARADSPFLVLPEPGVGEQRAAYRYANMSDEEALSELDRRGVLYARVEKPLPGVRVPIRLTGRLHGVYFHSALPPEQRTDSPFEILDARMALALDDFAALLEQHDIDEVVHFSMYRPNGPHPSHAARAQRANKPAQSPKPAVSPQKPGPALRGKAGLENKATPKAPEGTKQKETTKTQPKQPEIVGAPPKAASGHPRSKTNSKHQNTKNIKNTKSAKTPKIQPIIKPIPKKSNPIELAVAPAPAPKPASKAQQMPRTSWAPPGTRHPAGLAIDIGLLHKRDGRWLSVRSHFQGHIGDRACAGDSSAMDASTRDIRAVACQAMDRGLFTYILTPNYNAAHADHYHMEIKPGVRWYMIH